MSKGPSTPTSATLHLNLRLTRPSSTFPPPSRSPTALIIGASRGLGLALTQALHKRGSTVYATVRSSVPDKMPKEVNIIKGIDVGEEGAGGKVVEGLKGEKMDLVVVVAGILKPEVRARTTEGENESETETES